MPFPEEAAGCKGRFLIVHDLVIIMVPPLFYIKRKILSLYPPCTQNQEMRRAHLILEQGDDRQERKRSTSRRFMPPDKCFTFVRRQVSRPK